MSFSSFLFVSMRRFNLFFNLFFSCINVYRMAEACVEDVGLTALHLDVGLTALHGYRKEIVATL